MSKKKADSKKGGSKLQELLRNFKILEEDTEIIADDDDAPVGTLVEAVPYDANGDDSESLQALQEQVAAMAQEPEEVEEPVVEESAEDTNHYEVDENGFTVVTDAEGNKTYYDENGNEAYFDEEGSQYFIDENGYAFYYDEDGNVFYKDEDGNAFYIDENGESHYYEDPTEEPLEEVEEPEELVVEEVEEVEEPEEEVVEEVEEEPVEEPAPAPVAAPSPAPAQQPQTIEKIVFMPAPTPAPAPAPEKSQEEKAKEKYPQLAQLPVLLDLIMGQAVTKKVKIQVASSVLKLYEKYKHDPDARFYVLQCMSKVMAILQLK